MTLEQIEHKCFQYYRKKMMGEDRYSSSASYIQHEFRIYIYTRNKELVIPNSNYNIDNLIEWIKDSVSHYGEYIRIGLSNNISQPFVGLEYIKCIFLRFSHPTDLKFATEKELEVKAKLALHVLTNEIQEYLKTEDTKGFSHKLNP